MRTSEGYKTKQRILIEQVLKENGDRHVTAEEIAGILEQRGAAVGRTTVYRCLDRLSEDKKVRKYAAEPGESACYQYVSEDSCCKEHFHLKCVKCGRLIHIECEHMDELSAHIRSHHHFEVDRLKTVLYGICEDCAKK